MNGRTAKLIRAYSFIRQLDQRDLKTKWRETAPELKSAFRATMRRDTPKRGLRPGYWRCSTCAKPVRKRHQLCQRCYPSVPALPDRVAAAAAMAAYAASIHYSPPSSAQQLSPSADYWEMIL